MSAALEGEVVGAGGRPTKLTPELVGKLEAAFNNGFNISEACSYAEIDRTTYYDWLAKEDWFSYKMSKAQAAPNMKAKSIILQAISDGDVATARWYLDRRDPDFKPKGEIELPPGQQTTEHKLKEFMDDTNDGAYPDTGTADDKRSEPSATPELEGGEEVAPGPTDIS